MDDEDAAIDEDFSESEDEESEDPALLGYRFCAEETIRFLIEEENFATDDPIIRELEQHLNEQRMKLQQQRQEEKQGEEDQEKAQKDGECSSQNEPNPQSSELQPQDRKEEQTNAKENKNST